MDEQEILDVETREAAAARARLAPQPGDKFDFAAESPLFWPCAAGCGRFSAMKLCWECAQAQDRHAASLEAAQIRAERQARELERSIPPEFRWANAQASRELLESRIKLREKRAGVDEQGAIVWKSPDILDTLAKIVCHPLFLTFWGPARQGKTSLAVLGLRSRGGLFVCARKLSVARSQHKLGAGEAPLVARCLSASLLVLDDLGEEAYSNDSTVTHVLKERFSNDQPTWVTTGLTGDQMAARYGMGVKGRLTDPPRSWIVAFGAREAKAA